jgi:hypothetical protein
MLATVDEMFNDPSLTATDKSRMRDEYLNKLENAPTAHFTRGMPMPHQSGHGIDFTAASQPRTPLSMLQQVAGLPEITKALTAEGLASLTQALASMQVPDMTKDLSLTSPLSTGYVAFDLDAPAKMLTPKPTPLRNRIPRRRGMGTSHRFKRITGFTGTATGGVGVTWPGITSATQTNFANPTSANNLFFNRGPKISYAGDESSVLYQQFSLSDELDWATQFSGQGYQDMRALSRNAVLWSSMLMEERMLLYGRGTAAGFGGVLPAPTGVAVSAGRTLVAPEVGITNASGNLYVRVVAENGDQGFSQATAASAAGAYTAGQVVDVTYTLPPGATGARVFISLAAGADPGDASRFLYTTSAGTIYNGRSGFNKLTIQGTIQTAGTVPTAYTTTAGTVVNLTAADGGSAYATGYDGLLPYCTGATSGYTTKLNTTFSTTNPGVEYQAAFAAMYLAVKATPDRILLSAQDRVQISDAIKGTAASNYQLRIDQSDTGGYTMGALVTQIQNEAAGGIVSLDIHPWMPQGNSLILSDTLPIPDTQVDAVYAVYNVQDFMGIDWPVNQFSYDTSSYWYGAGVCFAPAWLGSVVGIQNNR